MGCTNQVSGIPEEDKKDKEKIQLRGRNTIPITSEGAESKKETKKEEEVKVETNEEKIQMMNIMNNENEDEKENNENENEDEMENIEKEEEEESRRSQNNENDEAAFTLTRDLMRQIEPYLSSKNDPNFNFPEVKENIYVGKGLKKMRAYISNISEEELIKKRKAFWGTRVEGNEQTWKFLQELCEMPETENNNIFPMLQAYELFPYKNCLNVTYDNLGGLYEIPNYCINDPYKYDLPELKKAQIPEKKISFHGKRGNEKIKIKCSNYSLVSKIRSKIGKKLQVQPEKIRLFFSGKELKDDMQLWVYNIDDDYVVIITVTT